MESIEFKHTKRIRYGDCVQEKLVRFFSIFSIFILQYGKYLHIILSENYNIVLEHFWRHFLKLIIGVIFINKIGIFLIGFFW